VSTAVRRAIYGRLASDTTLTGMLAPAPAGYTKAIYHEQAPENAQFPLVVFSRSSGVPVDTFGLPGAFESDVWLVKAVDRANSSDAAEAIDERVQVLLNDATLSIAGADPSQYLRRESDVEYAELVEGVTYRHHGSMFRLVITPA
jgi:hypothetical protein